MANITFILGGARSGKSGFAIGLAKKTARRVAFIATARPEDEEMKRRIKLHKKKRPSKWKTIEEPRDLASLIKNLPRRYRLIIIDCLTIYISNLMLEGRSDRYIEREVSCILKIIKNSDFESIIVSNEVGLSLVPDNPLGRRFRDLAGRVNQLVSGAADKAYFIVSGLPIKIKGAEDGEIR